ncbi:hybrid sensor histidine kinase/response regulator [Noviherbaspirillum galbum]|uniref:histidine kinase n=1 Tax=Noviherbaspirillum galbum TaxID=2709383 RepID=A0A6B3SXA4_9BURK|nr:ATP-binding protein [Noviherbaspirillum galbum]NEX62379.1 response regulator [Noviherbaspirillum galbum]
MGIRSRLLVLVFSILIPSLVGAGLVIYYVYHAQQQSYRTSIQDLGNAMAGLLDKEMTERIKVLDTLARSPTISDNNLEGFYRFAQEVAANHDAVIILSDAAGRQIMNTRRPFGETVLPGMPESILSQRQKLGPLPPVVSDIYFAPLSKGHSFAVQVPVERNGRLLYYLSTGSFTSQLQKLLDDHRLPAGWIATIIDRQGVVAARSLNPDKFVGASADKTLLRKIIAEKQGSNDGVTLDGTPVTAFFSQAPHSEWTFLVSVPSSALTGTARQATAFVALVALLLLGLGTAVAAVIARKTAKPLEDLRRAAADLGEGKRVGWKPSGVVEIDTVSLEMARASEQIRSAKADLEMRVAEAVATAERSQKALLQSQKLEALGRLTGGIAHDFNNVMQTLTTGLQLILFATVEPRVRQTVEACQRAVERSAELTRQLMAFGRVQEVHLETVDLARQLEAIRPLLIGGLRSDIDLNIALPPGLWPVTVDAAQLELALLNVAINARDAMPLGGSVSISAGNLTLTEAAGELVAGDYVRITVTDTGEGMPPDVLSKALDPFFTTKPVGRGSGMGLPQAYGFARQVGGSLAIDSLPGRGTTIAFHLPRAIESLPGRNLALPQPMPGPAGSSGTLLYVEDDPLVSSVVAPALRAAGFEVREAANAADAIVLLASHGPFDVVFSDIVMPGQSTGIDLAEHVRTRYPETVVVLATGYSERQAAVPGVKILAKPYDVADAVAIIRNAMATEPGVRDTARVPDA